MATTQTARPVRSPAAALRSLRRPLHLWHLLSLDAPTVATLWTLFLARSVGLHLPLSNLLAMFLAVWTLYAADRLLDARPLFHHPSASGLEARHVFHDRHRSAFFRALILTTLLLGLLLPSLSRTAMRLDLLLGAFLAGYFVLIHATRSASRLPKEIAVGLFFAAACFIPTVARRPELRSTLLPAALLFACLCSLNCVVIFALESPPGTLSSVSLSAPVAHPLTRLAVRHLRSLAFFVLGASVALLLAGSSAVRPAAVAIAAATLGLLWIRSLAQPAPHRALFHPTTLRALADLALCTPLLVWPWLLRR